MKGLLPLPKRVRLLGLTLANFEQPGEVEAEAEAPVVEDELEPVLPF